MTQTVQKELLVTMEQLRELGKEAAGQVVDHDLSGNPITDYDVLFMGAYAPAIQRLVSLVVEKVVDGSLGAPKQTPPVVVIPECVLEWVEAKKQLDMAVEVYNDRLAAVRSSGDPFQSVAAEYRATELAEKTAREMLHPMYLKLCELLPTLSKPVGYVAEEDDTTAGGKPHMPPVTWYYQPPNGAMIYPHAVVQTSVLPSLPDGWKVKVVHEGGRHGTAIIKGPKCFHMEFNVSFSMLDFMKSLAKGCEQ